MRSISLWGELFVLTSLILLFIATACQTGQSVNAKAAAGAVTNPEETVAVVPPALNSSAAPPTLPPPLTATAAMPSFALESPADLTRAALPAATIPPTSLAVTTPNAAPTTTSPALRFTSTEEHYWFWRPIREGETNWTDKVYTYGSTRGGTLRPHHGVEFYVPTGTDIIATASGTVVFAGNDATFIIGPEANFYGNLVIIEHDARWRDQPVFTLYAHLSEIGVNEGQHVLEQQLIARSGATGVADGAHLHFEVRVGQNSYEATRNPLLWLYPFPDRGVVVGRVQTTAGELLPGMQVVLTPVETVDGRAHQTTTYASGSVIGDPLWDENFALDDVYSGVYKATVAFGEVKFSQELSVLPYQTSFVEIVVDLTAVPPTATPEDEE